MMGSPAVVGSGSDRNGPRLPQDQSRIGTRQTATIPISSRMSCTISRHPELANCRLPRCLQGDSCQSHSADRARRSQGRFAGCKLGSGLRETAGNRRSGKRTMEVDPRKFDRIHRELRLDDEPTHAATCFDVCSVSRSSACPEPRPRVKWRRWPPAAGPRRGQLVGHECRPARPRLRPEVRFGKFEILATYTYARALAAACQSPKPRLRGIVAAVMASRTRGCPGRPERRSSAKKSRKSTLTAATFDAQVAAQDAAVLRRVASCPLSEAGRRPPQLLSGPGPLRSPSVPRLQPRSLQSGRRSTGKAHELWAQLLDRPESNQASQPASSLTLCSLCALCSKISLRGSSASSLRRLRPSEILPKM